MVETFSICYNVLMLKNNTISLDGIVINVILTKKKELEAWLNKLG